MNEVLFSKLQRLKEESKYLEDNKSKFLKTLNSSIETKKIVERSVYLCSEIILDIADLVLIMTVNPGFGGQEFIGYTLEKIKKLAEIRTERKLNFLIEADGGIDETNIVKIKDAGCDVIVSGTSIFKNENITEITARFKNLLT